MSYFPFFVNIKDEPALIIGGGKVALHKARILMPFEVFLTVVSSRFTEDWEGLEGAHSSGNIQRVVSKVDGEDLDDSLARAGVGRLEGYGFVVDASADPVLSRALYQACRSRRIPLNVVDQPSLCTFIFPALIVEDPLTIAISTAGASPAAASDLKKQIRARLPKEVSPMLKDLERRRPAIMAQVSETNRRSRIYHRLWEETLRRGRALSDEEAEEVVSQVVGES